MIANERCLYNYIITVERCFFVVFSRRTHSDVCGSGSWFSFDCHNMLDVASDLAGTGPEFLCLCVFASVSQQFGTDRTINFPAIGIRFAKVLVLQTLRDTAFAKKNTTTCV
jgi:hypothetical protein